MDILAGHFIFSGEGMTGFFYRSGIGGVLLYYSFMLRYALRGTIAELSFFFFLFMYSHSCVIGINELERFGKVNRSAVTQKRRKKRLLHVDVFSHPTKLNA